MFQSIELKQGINLHIRKTDQFKTVNFSFKFKQALSEQSASERSVLANVLLHSNEQYPSNPAFRSYLDELYGTAMYMDSSKRGNEHFVTLLAESVNDQYLSTGGVLERVMDLLKVVLFNPNVENGVFKESIIKREKDSVIQRIESLYDDKTRYAQHRLVELLRPNHPASIGANGTIELVQAITPTSLWDAYQRMLNEDELDIYVVGDIDEANMTNSIKEAFPLEGRTPLQKQKIEQHNMDPKNPSHVKETQDMKQGKLHIGFETPITFTHPDFPIMQITNGIFGGYPHAKLFMNVREKESMAYYVSSSFSSSYGLIFVLAGIDASKEEKAISLIDEQLEALKKGEITKMEIDQTVAMLKNQLKEALDSARGQIEIFDQYKELDETFRVEDWFAKWSSVTKDDVQKMANTIDKKMVYFLSGKEESSNEGTPL
ncbi:MAG: EF-P 5-aminopentanol modification-associated protein YfmF [Paenisporosarcina sp.]